jgi:hypothetical protein
MSYIWRLDFQRFKENIQKVRGCIPARLWIQTQNYSFAEDTLPWANMLFANRLDSQNGHVEQEMSVHMNGIRFNSVA